MSDAGSSPTSTMPRPGGRPTRAANAAAAGATSARIWFATATPSSSRAVKLPAQSAICNLQSAISSHRLCLELLQRLRMTEHDELVVRENRRVRLRVEFHALVRTLNADHDHAESLTQIRFENRLVGQPRSRRDGHLF